MSSRTCPSSEYWARVKALISYFIDMERMRLKYDVKKVFVDENDVCLFYDLTISGTTIFGCAWYQVQGGRIHSLKVIFDPRPVLAARAA